MTGSAIAATVFNIEVRDPCFAAIFTDDSGTLVPVG